MTKITELVAALRQFHKKCYLCTLNFQSSTVAQMPELLLFENANAQLGVDPIDLNYLSRKDYDEKPLEQTLTALSQLNTDKSYLLTALVPENALPAVTQAFTAIATLITQADFTSNWQAKKLVTPFNDPRFSMINVFLTNNKQPQLVYLGADVMRYLTKDFYINDQNNFGYGNKRLLKPLIAELSQLTYFWQKQNLDYCVKPLTILDDKTNASKKAVIAILNDAIKMQLRNSNVFLNKTLQEIIDNNEAVNFHSGYDLKQELDQLKSIVIINLDWLMQTAKQQKPNNCRMLYKHDLLGTPIGKKLLQQVLKQMSE